MKKFINKLIKVNELLMKKKFFYLRLKKNLNEGVRNIPDLNVYKENLDFIIRYISKSIIKYAKDNVELNKKPSTVIINFSNSFNISNMINFKTLNMLQINIFDSHIFELTEDDHNKNNNTFVYNIKFGISTIVVDLKFNNNIRNIQENLSKNLFRTLAEIYFIDHIKGYKNINDQIIPNINLPGYNYLYTVLYALKRSTLDRIDAEIIEFINSYLSEYSKFDNFNSKELSRVKNIFDNLKIETDIYNTLYKDPIQALKKLQDIMNVENQNSLLNIMKFIFPKLMNNKSYNEAIIILENKIESLKDRIVEHIVRQLKLKK